MYKVINYKEYCLALKDILDPNEATPETPSWFWRAQSQAIKTIRSEIMDTKIFPVNNAMLHQLFPKWREMVINCIAEQTYYTHNQQYFIENGQFANRSYSETQYGEGPVTPTDYQEAIKRLCNPAKAAILETGWLAKRYGTKFDPKLFYTKYDPILKDVNWGNIGGWLDDQADLIEYLANKYTSVEEYLIFKHDINAILDEHQISIDNLEDRVGELENNKVRANPGGTFEDVLTSVIIDGVNYGIGSGSFDPSRYYTKAQTDEKIDEVRPYVVAITSHQTVNEQEVPSISPEDLYDLYLNMADGTPTFIYFDPNESGETTTFAITQCSMVNTPASISFDFKDIMKLTYTLDGDNVNITYKEFGGEGVSDYNELTNKPSINGITLQNNKSGTDLGIQNKTDTDLETVSKDIVGAINEVNDKAQATTVNYVIDLQNPANLPFVSTNETITATSFVTTSGVTVSTSELMIGASVYNTDSANPDRWYAGDDTFYILRSEKPDLSNYVTLDGTQNISGQKTFTNGMLRVSNQGGTNVTSFSSGSINVRGTYTLTYPLQTGTLALTSDVEPLSQRISDVETAITSLSENKQEKYDEELETTNKYIVGAINEVNAKQALPEIPDPNKTYVLKAINNVVTWVEESEEPVASDFETDDWSTVAYYAGKGFDALKTAYNKTTFIGLERTVTVQGVEHTVRVIGENHDNLSDGSGKAALTFEFKNLISDSTGHSIATVWNWQNGSDSTNYDYTNSNIRKALEGEGSGTIAWYQKSSSTKSTVYTTSIYSMLPDDVKNNIKRVSKVIGIGTPTNGTHIVKDENGKDIEVPNASYTNQEYNAYVFVPSYREMTASGTSTYQTNEGTTYEYYVQHDDNASRQKSQINSSDFYTDYPTISDVSHTAYNYAGYCNESYSGCCYHWLRSPYTSYTRYAWIVSLAGGLDIGYVCRVACAVAPCFCI